MSRVRATDRAAELPRGEAQRSVSLPWRLALFLLATLCVKLAVVVQLKDHILLQADAGLDTSAYIDLARRVIGGDRALGPHVYFVSPLYVYFLAGVLGPTGSLTAVRVVQVVLGTAAVALIFAAAREWFGDRAGWLAAALASVTGVLTFYETLIIQAALDPFLTAAALAGLAYGLRRDRWRWFLASGICFGLGTLNRPNVLLPALTVAALLGARRRWRAASALIGGLAIAFAPVALRNAIVAGDWSPLPSQGGLNFYIGNNPAADGTYRPVPGIRPSIEGQEYNARQIAEGAVGHALSDREVSSYFYARGIAWIRSTPIPAARLSMRKLAYVFDRAPIFLNYSYPFFAYDEGTLLRALAAGAWLVIPLGLVGILWRLRETDRWTFATWAAFVPAYAIATAMFFVSDRYRLPLLVPLAITAGGGLEALWRAIERRRRPALVMLAATLAVLLVAVNWPVRVDEGRAEERTRMAERLIQLGRYDEADRWATRAQDGYPRPAVLQVRIGRQFLLAHQWPPAVAHLERAAQLEPGEVEVEYRLGQALLESGRPGDAIPHLRGALARDPSRPLVPYDLARALAATGDRDGALAALRGVRPSTVDTARTDLAYGELAMSLGGPALAESFFHAAIVAAPDMAGAHQQLGLALGLENRSAEASVELQTALRLDPADPVSHLNLAVVFAQAGRYDEARREAEAALRLEPSYVRARALLDALPR